MFKLIVSTNEAGEIIRHVEHIASCAHYTLPDGAKALAVDSEGELWAYESGKPHILGGDTWWSDSVNEGWTMRIGTLPSDHLPEGMFPEWRKSMILVSSMEEDRTRNDPVAAAVSPPQSTKLDGRKLRGKVTEILDQAIRDGKPGANHARAALRDLGSHGFEFSNYRTLDLVQAFLEMGYDLRMVRHFNPVQEIDKAVHQAWGE